MGTKGRRPIGSWIDWQEAYNKILNNWKVIGRYGEADWMIILDGRTPISDFMKCHSYELLNERLEPKMTANKNFVPIKKKTRKKKSHEKKNC